MSDIKCAKCGEPWDAYGIRNGDMEKDEAARFLKGEGCPCCGFGGRCPSCDGTGIDPGSWPHECEVCNDKGYTLAWQPRRSSGGYRNDRVYTGYSPNVKTLPDDIMDNRITFGVRTFPEKADSFQSRDGWVDQWWVNCPYCYPKNRMPCPACEGTGALPDPDEDLELEAARDEIDNSDEDGVEILIRRGLI